jgi:hypothetical protein
LVGTRVEVEQTLELRFDVGNIGSQSVSVKQVALFASPRRVADHARRTTGKHDWSMPEHLESAQRNLPEQVAGV